MNKLGLYIGLLMFLCHISLAQNGGAVSYQKEADDLLAYYNFMLNAMGDSSLTAKEKDIIVSESYKKLYRDEKVQIEDDLTTDREVVTNKDVQAYLKDVNFFFKQVQFSYRLLNMQHLVNAAGRDYLKLHCNRTLTGQPVDKDTLISHQQERYIEVMIDADSKDLKIVSVYTHKINEQAARIAWWNALPLNWKENLGRLLAFDREYSWSDVVYIDDAYLVFKSAFVFDSTHSSSRLDTLSYYNDSMQNVYKDKVRRGLYNIQAIDTLDVSHQPNLYYLEPLSALTSLEYLKLSHTMVSDLKAIRNLLKIKHLDLSFTMVQDLSPLAFSNTLMHLNLQQSLVQDVSALANLSALRYLNLSNTACNMLPGNPQWQAMETLNISHTAISDIAPLHNCKMLQYFEAQHSLLSNVSTLSVMPQLKTLNISHTEVSDLKALDSLQYMESVRIDHTPISDLSALANKKTLKKIYADSIALDKSQLMLFAQDNPHLLLMWAKDAMQRWYSELSPAWRAALQKQLPFKLEAHMSLEQLHQMSKIKSIDISHEKSITDLEPLRLLYGLERIEAEGSALQSLEGIEALKYINYLNISDTEVKKLTQLSNLRTLQTINLSHTGVSDLSVLANMKALQRVEAKGCTINTLNPLQFLENLKYVNIDSCKIAKAHLLAFLSSRKAVDVIYQTEKAMSWWQTLSKPWRRFFSAQQNWTQAPTNEQLHRLLRSSALSIHKQADLQQFSCLQSFKLLEDLSIQYCQLSGIRHLWPIESLRRLDISNNPVESLEDIGFLSDLQQLNISNTAVGRLDDIESLKQLEVLDISGTAIKRLKPLRQMRQLHTLFAANSRVASLSDLEKVPLQKLRVFNTRLKYRKVEDYKAKHPHCTVEFY